MKQVLQQARTGEIEVVDVPSPQLLAGSVLVRIGASLVSAGTERASAEFAAKNLLQKAQARPDLVREVISKVRRNGLFSAVAAVRSRLDQPLALGYSSAGTVVAVGEGVNDTRAGDRVACAGAGYAVHAEFACVPRLLVARIPDGTQVGFDEAAFTTVGAVALHGVRTADARVGDLVAVIGLGLLGQLTVQVLKAAGCRVIGMDIASDRVSLARRLGADAASDSASMFAEMCFDYSNGHGADAVIVAAETPSSDPVNVAGRVARDRAVVVAVGTVGMDIERKAFYEKELDFRVSRSYGPGRYDEAYEQKGRDYPIGYVRWTETRNMEAFLQLVTDGKLDLQSLITHRFPIEQAQAAYDVITGKSSGPSLGVLITYAEDQPGGRRLELMRRAESVPGKIAVGVLGAGTFATATLLPAIKKSGADLSGICAANGSHSRHAAEKFGFCSCTTDEREILDDPKVNTIVIATRHHLHAGQVLAALEAGKHVFCEKPLCLNEVELDAIVQAYENRSERRLLMVGFNRRFAPMAVQMRSFLGEAEPLAMNYRVNAGALPPDHWTRDPEQGGGRLLGEVCHFIDFLGFLAGSVPVSVEARGLGSANSSDSVIVSLTFANGSQGTVSYLANGDRSFSKERLEAFGGGRVAVLDDFRRLELVRDGRKQLFRSRFRLDKGHRDEWNAFVSAIGAGGPSPIPFAEIVSSTLTTFCAAESLATGQPVTVDHARLLKLQAE